MLINKTTHSVDIFDLYPNFNWLGDEENYYLVDDNSELGIAIKEAGPLSKYDFIIENDQIIGISQKEQIEYYSKQEIDQTLSEYLTTKIWRGTEEEYEALGVYDEDTIYFIKNLNEEVQEGV